MASPAQIEGARLITELARGQKDLPTIGICAWRMKDETGIRFALSPNDGHAWRGEYQSTVRLPNLPGPARNSAMARLKQLVERRANVARMRSAYRSEMLECDGDDSLEIGDDMPVATSRMHCPLAIRRAFDVCNIDDGRRAFLIDTSGIMSIGKATITIDDIETDENLNEIWVTRATISAPGVTYTQGKTRNYLRIEYDIPRSLAIASIGRSPGVLVDLPGMDAEGLIIEKVETSKKGVNTFIINRGFDTVGNETRRECR